MRNLIILLLTSLFVQNSSLAQDEPRQLPPLPAPTSGSFLSDQAAEIEALTPEEVQQIFTPVNLDLKTGSEFRIRTSPEVYLDTEHPDRGMIEPPPLQQSSFDTSIDPISLHMFPGSGVESPFYTPVAPFCYPPLYFEEPYLERYGDGYCDPLQVLVSGTKFYGRIPLLPFMCMKQSPHEQVLNLWADPVDEAR